MDMEWELQPLESPTGQAYLGIKGRHKIFVKRNATPFLAAVSTEGLAPKMLWTKRTLHGEVLTAQEWLDARTLKPEEMVEYDILNLIKYIHQSKRLLGLLYKMESRETTPQDLLQEYRQNLQHDLETHSFLNKIVDYLQRQSDTIAHAEKVVCHGELTHDNFLLDTTQRLYVVDWDTVKIADPFLDLSAFLCQYVAINDWSIWLSEYHMVFNQQTLDRLEWYALYYCLMSVKKYHFQGNYHEMNHHVMLIKQVIKHIHG